MTAFIASPLMTSQTTLVPALQASSATVERIVAGAPCVAFPQVDDHENITAGTPMMQPANALTPILIPLRYRKQVFPDGCIPAISEVPAHFDVKGIMATGKCSYHTEYASKCRTFTSPLLEGLEAIKASHRKGVPELWTSPVWALEMVEFIRRLAAGKEPPAVIEIHPPFVNSVPTMDAFLDIYTVFEEAVLAHFPECRFVIENRSGTKHPHSFLVSGIDSIVSLGHGLSARSLRLGIAFDLPQMFTAEYGSKHLIGVEGVSLLERLLPIREQIQTLHLWGRGEGGGAHSGGLDGLFAVGGGAKEACLSVLKELCNGAAERHLVLEVANGDDLASILRDLAQAGIVCAFPR